MTWNSFFLLFLVALCTVASQSLFKLGFLGSYFGFDFQTFKYVLTTPLLLISVALYFSSIVIRGKVLAATDFSAATTLLTALVFIITLLFGVLLFNDSLNSLKISGIFLVVLGMALVRHNKEVT